MKSAAAIAACVSAIYFITVSAGATSNDGGPISGEADKVWNEYRSMIDATRKLMLARPESREPHVRASALYASYAMQSEGFQMFIAPRQNYPVFYRQSIWSPFEVTFGGPAADFVYEWTFLDGARTYRITGKRGTTRFVDFHLFNGYFDRLDQKSLGNYDLDDFKLRTDGTFEIILSAAPHPGNWIKLDPDAHNTVIQLRDAFYDWGHEQRVTLHVETLDRVADTMYFDETELNGRALKAARHAKGVIEAAIHYLDRIKHEAGGINQFGQGEYQGAANRGASPRAHYLGMVFEIEPDEALIIESEVPKARYWSVQLTDLWWQTLDFSYHQSGLNGFQAHIDTDGKLRAVLSQSDPGVPNWLDPIGTPTGEVMMREYDGAPFPMPKVTKVKLSALRAHLPKETPIVSPSERAVALKQRARDSLSRWGY